jgi:hypothetical protein
MILITNATNNFLTFRIIKNMYESFILFMIYFIIKDTLSMTYLFLYLQ